MRYIFAITFLLLFSSFVSYAQEFNGGVIGGATISQIDGDSFGGFHKIGPNAGIFVRNSFGDKFNGRMELKYIQKGSAMFNKDFAMYYKVRLNYIEIPYSIEYKMPKIKLSDKTTWDFKDRLFVHAGLYLATLISATEDEGYGPNNASFAFTRIEGGAHVGFTYFISDHVGFDYRFAYSFIPIRGRPQTREYYWVGFEFNRLMCFALMYQF